MMLYLHGKITEDGELKVELPPGLAAGDVEITIARVEPQTEEADEEIEVRPTWTEEEVRKMMKPNPMTGAEIVAELKDKGVFGSWADMEIEDPVEWLQ